MVGGEPTTTIKEKKLKKIILEGNRIRDEEGEYWPGWDIEISEWKIILRRGLFLGRQR